MSDTMTVKPCATAGCILWSQHGLPCLTGEELVQAIADKESVLRERDQWRRNYYDVADALATGSSSPAHLASIARDLRQQLADRDRQIADLKAALRSVAEGKHETSQHCPVCIARAALSVPAAESNKVSS